MYISLFLQLWSFSHLDIAFATLFSIKLDVDVHVVPYLELDPSVGMLCFGILGQFQCTTLISEKYKLYT